MSSSGGSQGIGRLMVRTGREALATGTTDAGTTTDTGTDSAPRAHQQLQRPLQQPQQVVLDNAAAIGLSSVALRTDDSDVQCHVPADGNVGAGSGHIRGCDGGGGSSSDAAVPRSVPSAAGSTARGAQQEDGAACDDDIARASLLNAATGRQPPNLLLALGALAALAEARKRHHGHSSASASAGSAYVATASAASHARRDAAYSEHAAEPSPLSAVAGYLARGPTPAAAAASSAPPSSLGEMEPIAGAAAGAGAATTADEEPGSQNGALASSVDGGVPNPFTPYYGLLIHQQNMLQDSVRTGAYYNAIIANAADFKDKVVMDVGTGSGILAWFAYKAGARKVYAIEASAVADRAAALLAANGVGDKIVVLKQKVEDVVLTEQVRRTTNTYVRAPSQSARVTPLLKSSSTMCPPANLDVLALSARAFRVHRRRLTSLCQSRWASCSSTNACWSRTLRLVSSL